MPKDPAAYIIIFFSLLNLTAFLVMAADKRRAAAAGSERISEGLMFFWGTIGAALGIYVGMFAFRHKTRKWYFLLGIPLLIAQNAALAYWLIKINL